MTKKFSEIYLLEIEQWVSEVLQEHQRSMIYSFIFIHSVRSKTDNDVHSIHRGFHKELGGKRSKEEISRFHIWDFESDKSLGKKFIFFKSLETTEPSRIFRPCVKIHVFLPVNFPEQFEPCFYFKYSRSYEAL